MSSNVTVEVHCPAELLLNDASASTRGVGDVVLMVGGYVSTAVAVIQGPRALTDLISALRRLADRSESTETVVHLSRRGRQAEVIVRCKRGDDWTHLVKAINDMDEPAD